MMRLIKIASVTLIAISGIVIWSLYALLSSIKPYDSEKLPPHQFSYERISDLPIITIDSHKMLLLEAEEFGYTNINGPSLIKVPDWMENSLGKYYLYFAHHKGRFIRLAYADSLDGVWTVADNHILPLEESTLAIRVSKTNLLQTLRKYNTLSENIALYDVGAKYQKDYEAQHDQRQKVTPPTAPHLASPDVVVDNENQQIRLYYHGVIEGKLQKSKVALSTNGINFEANDEIIALPYLRMFKYRDMYYGLAMPGFMYRSKDGLTDFEVRKRWFFDTNHRHHGLYLRGNILYVFFTNVGDNPESIKYVSIDLTEKDWNKWRTTQAVELMRPGKSWEGADEKQLPSLRGEVGTRVHQLRDPDIFEDDNGQLYMLYTGGGEQAIGMVKLQIENR